MGSSSGRCSPRVVRRAWTVGLAGLALAVLGCGSDDSSSGSGAGKESAEGKKVVFISCTDQNPYCATYNKTFKEALEKEGVELTILTNNFDSAVEQQQYAQAISRRPDLIVNLPADSSAVIQGMTRAKQADIPVIIVNSPVDPKAEALAVSSIIVDYAQLGRFAAINLQEGLKKRGLRDANVVAVTGTTSMLEVSMRMDAFKKQLASTPEYRLVESQDGNWDPVRTAEITPSLLAKYRGKGGIQGAYGMADYMAAAIVRAAEQSGYPVGVEEKGLIVTGSNCAGVGIQAIESGKMYGGATQSPITEAEKTAPYVVRYLQGEEISKKVLHPQDRITQENVDKFASVCDF
jgi:ABC-type sugar transport system substrate-binding protein